MADITRRIVTRFEATGGNVRAVLGGMAQGYRQTSTAAKQLGNDQSYLNSQMRAFGTTIRYALAGTAVFGAAGTISTLSEVQRQLGLMAAIGDVTSPTGQKIRLIGPALEKTAKEIRGASVDIVQPITAVNDAVINFLSTVQDVPRDQIVKIVEELGKGATLAQVPVEELTKAATTMNIAFGKTNNLQNITKITKEFFTLTRLAPGGPQAGAQIIQQFGPLASVFALGGGTPEQLMSLTLAGLRFGGTPSTSLRGLQYLTQSIIQPATPKAAKALASIGITPNTVSAEGVYPNIIRLLNYIHKLPGHGNANVLGRLSDTSLDDLESQYGPTALEKTPGGLSGPAAQFLRTAIGRIHGIRAAVVLAAQLERRGDTQSLAEDLKIIADRSGKEQQRFNEAWKDFLDTAKLPRAATALQALGQDIATEFAPILGLAAGGIIGAERVTRHHEKAVAYGLGGLAAAYIGLRGVRGILGRGGAALGVAGKAAVISSSLNAAEGQWAGMPGESIQNPIFAVIVGQITGPGGWIGKGRGAAQTAEREAEKEAEKKAEQRVASRWASRISTGLGTRLGMAARIGGVPAAIASTLLFSDAGASGNLSEINKRTSNRLAGHPFLQNAFAKFRAGQPLTPTETEALKLLKFNSNWDVQTSSIPVATAFLRAQSTGKLPASIPFKSMFERAIGGHGGREVKLKGEANVTIKVESRDETGKKKIQSGVIPVQLAPQFGDTVSPKPPGAKGKNFTVPRGF